MAQNPKRPGLVVVLKFLIEDKARAWFVSHEANVLELVQAEVSHPGIVRLRNVHNDLGCVEFDYVKGWTLPGRFLIRLPDSSYS
jgi:hypothetical protein